MRVSVISATANPVEVISMAAGTCYGKGDTVSERRVASCFNDGHLSVFEHASVTLRVESISRACMAQLTRHRLCSFCVESQRFCKYDLSGDDWYVMPPEFAKHEGTRKFFEGSVTKSASDYMISLENGIKPEDARYLLPEATKTNLVMTLNCRELYHLMDMRLAKSAQWEIRALMGAVCAEVAQHSYGWNWLMELWGD